MCICMFAYRSRRDKRICSKLGMLMPWNQQEILERSKLRKMSWIRVRVRVVFLTWEISTTEERRQDQSWSTSRLQEQRPQLRIVVLGSSPVKMVSVARKLSTTEQRRQDRSCLFRRGAYINKGHSPESWVKYRVVVNCKYFFLALTQPKPT
jgi:hypothetical protein